VQAHGRHDLQHADDEGPRRDHVQEHQGRQPRPEERDESSGDAHDGLERKQPPGLVRAAAHGRDEAETPSTIA